jgi:hypothetical protein
VKADIREPDDRRDSHHGGRAERTWGTLKESLAGGSALAKATLDSGANTLVKAVAADFVTSEG